MGAGNKVYVYCVFTYIALIGIKTVSEVKLKQIFMCCECSVDFSMFGWSSSCRQVSQISLCIFVSYLYNIDWH